MSLAFSGSDSTIDSESLCTLGKLTKLQELDLSGLNAVTNEVLIAISVGCKNLKKLTLRSCIYLADEGVKELVNLEHMELIDISGCLLVSHDAVQSIINFFSTTKKVKHEIDCTKFFSRMDTQFRFALAALCAKLTKFG